MIRKRIVQLSRLSFQEWHWLLTAQVLLPVIGILLYTVGFKRTYSMAVYIGYTINVFPETNQQRYAIRMANTVYIAANHGLYRANCLNKSLLIWFLLARKGIPGNLRIGVNNQNEQFSAHAWVECKGIALAEPPETSSNPRFSAFSL